MEFKILGERMTDFEKNLYLKKQVEQLKDLLTKSGIKKAFSEKDIEIGKLKSERDEMKHNYFQACKEIDALRKELEEKSKKKKLSKEKLVKVKDLKGDHIQKIYNQSIALEQTQESIRKLKEELQHYRKRGGFILTPKEKQEQLIEKYDPQTIEILLNELVEAEQALTFNSKYFLTIQKNINL